MISDRTLVLLLALVTLALLTAATATGNAAAGWASLVAFVSLVAAYVRWRLRQRGRRMS